MFYYNYDIKTKICSCSYFQVPIQEFVVHPILNKAKMIHGDIRLIVECSPKLKDF